MTRARRPAAAAGALAMTARRILLGIGLTQFWRRENLSSRRGAPSADEGFLAMTDRETRTSAGAMLAPTTMLWGGDGEDRVEDTATVTVVREDEAGASASGPVARGRGDER